MSFAIVFTHADNEFTQLMKGLQGERLRQAFKFLDKDQDGFIRSEQFKRIILVSGYSEGPLPGPRASNSSPPFLVL